ETVRVVSEVKVREQRIIDHPHESRMRRVIAATWDRILQQDAPRNVHAEDEGSEQRESKFKQHRSKRAARQRSLRVDLRNSFHNAQHRVLSVHTRRRQRMQSAE